LAALIKKIIRGVIPLKPSGPWMRIAYATLAQEAVLRLFAVNVGFKNLRGFNKYMESMDWDYYDVIKLKYTD
jgi:hypothetical protein